MVSSQTLFMSLSQVTARTLELGGRPPTSLIPPHNSSIFRTTPYCSVCFNIHDIPIVAACEFIDRLKGLVVDDCKVGGGVTENQVGRRGEGSDGQNIWFAWNGVGQGGIGRRD
jgi:hypothetical protein